MWANRDLSEQEMSKNWVLPSVALMASLMLTGCFTGAGGPGTANPVFPPAVDPADNNDGAGNGGTGGAGDQNDGGDGDVGTDGDMDTNGDAGTDGAGGDVNTDGQPGDGDVGTDGDMGTDGDGGIQPFPPPTSGPTVTLVVSDPNPSPSETIFLTCVALDQGSAPITGFDFVSSIGGGEIVHDDPANPTASATIPPGLFFINYQCQASTSEGTGPLSDIVRVDIAQQ